MKLGNTKEEKAFKADVSEKIFGTGSWEKLKTLPISQLEVGKMYLETYKNIFREYITFMEQNEGQWSSQYALTKLDEVLSEKSFADELIEEDIKKGGIPGN